MDIHFLFMDCYGLFVYVMQFSLVTFMDCDGLLSSPNHVFLVFFCDLTFMCSPKHPSTATFSPPRVTQPQNGCSI